MSSMRLYILLSALLHANGGICPKGFSSDSFFPKEWQIPKWPSNLTIDEVSKLRFVKLGGFKKESLNEEYLEGPTDDYQMQGQPTYWQESGEYFMYYCERFKKWRIAAISAFGKNMDGNCYAFVSDGYPYRDILDPKLIKGWIEVEDGQWQNRSNAGVVAIGTMGQELLADSDSEEDTVADGSKKCETPTDSTESNEKKSNCPVMPVVRGVKKKVVEVSAALKRWVRRFTASYLSAPSEEDAIPEDQGKDDASRMSAEKGSCNLETQEGCSYREKFYIEKQRNVSKEKRQQELERLQRMESVVMKPEQLEWLSSRIGILRIMVKHDEL
eukprot:TRINITY_DN39305_c0_g1_i1.p1 TRINITY_DN39305_c0_g1~~TRINITY_DN39305_c0_g1_i1.p1  ORF type:complete len:341 (+),score=53.95 TRINITY_DN39305_c0_g1_i1:42-1025(+)